MSLFAFIVISGGVVMTIVVSTWLFSRYRGDSGMQISQGSDGDDAGDKEVAIPTTRIYQDTKEKMSLLRVNLDDVMNAAYSIDDAGRAEFDGDVCKTYGEAVSQMHMSLCEAWNSADALVAYVERKPSEDAVVPKISVEVRKVPSTLLSTTGAPESSEAQRLYSGLLKTIDDTGPFIAGFYYALTDSDDNTQAASATWHLVKVREKIVEAVEAVVALEKELAG